MEDYYEILGVDKNASKEEIKRKYKELVKKYHPDKHKNNPLEDLSAEKLKEIIEAYDILSDDKKRAEYDRKIQKGTQQFSDAKSSTGDYDSFLSKIDLHINNRNLVKGLKLCDEAISLNNSRFEAYMYKGVIYHQQHNFTEAVRHYCIAEEKGANRPETNYDVANFNGIYGIALVEAAKSKDAINKLDTAISLAGDIPNYLAYLAIAYEQIGMKDKANIVYNKLKEIAPTHPVFQTQSKDTSAGCGIFSIVHYIFDSAKEGNLYFKQFVNFLKNKVV